MKKNEVIKACDEVITRGDAFMNEAAKFTECVGILLTAVKAFRAVIEPDVKEAGHE